MSREGDAVHVESLAFVPARTGKNAVDGRHGRIILLDAHFQMNAHLALEGEEMIVHLETLLPRPGVNAEHILAQGEGADVVVAQPGGDVDDDGAVDDDDHIVAELAHLFHSRRRSGREGSRRFVAVRYSWIRADMRPLSEETAAAGYETMIGSLLLR